VFAGMLSVWMNPDKVTLLGILPREHIYTQEYFFLNMLQFTNLSWIDISEEEMHRVLSKYFLTSKEDKHDLLGKNIG
jgi:hypothetical protein